MAEIGKFPGAQKYDQTIPFKKVKDFKVPGTKRTSNDPIVQNDSVSPQTYDVLSGHGYVDVKNLELMTKMSKSPSKFGISRNASLIGHGSHSVLPMNKEIARDASIQRIQLFHTNASKANLSPEQSSYRR